MGEHRHTSTDTGRPRSSSQGHGTLRPAPPTTDDRARAAGLAPRAAHPARVLDERSVLDLQRSIGNHGVARLVAGAATDRDDLPVGASEIVVQRAGHEDAWSFTTDRRHVVKITSTSEADTYRDAEELGIDGVIPGEFTQVSVEELADYSLKRELRAPKASERIIVIENLAPPREGDAAPVILDAKIGFHTASGTQAAKEGVSMPWFKALRHDIIDTVMYSSRSVGYRFEEGKQWIDDAERLSTGATRNATGLAPSDLAVALRSICRDLVQIQTAMTTATVTFVGSSALMVVFPDNPAASKAKLIDFAHPIRDDDDAGLDYFERYRRNFTGGIASLIGYLSRIAGGLQVSGDGLEMSEIMVGQ